MFKKIILSILIVAVLFSTMGALNASTSQITLFSEGTDHKFVTTVTTSNQTYYFVDDYVACTKSSTHYFENNGKPYTVTVNSKAWWEVYGTTKSFYNDMSDYKKSVVADTTYDTIWNGGHLKFRKSSA